MQVCTLLQADNHANIPPLSFFYRSDALPAAQPTASKHWRSILQCYCSILCYVIPTALKREQQQSPNSCQRPGVVTYFNCSIPICLYNSKINVVGAFVIKIDTVSVRLAFIWWIETQRVIYWFYSYLTCTVIWMSFLKCAFGQHIPFLLLRFTLLIGQQERLRLCPKFFFLGNIFNWSTTCNSVYRLPLAVLAFIRSTLSSMQTHCQMPKLSF